MKIGIMGGTFDPIHIGHLMAAEYAAEQAGIDEVWFVPTHAPPHKAHSPSASAADRLKMVELAIQGNSRFQVLDWEIRSGGISYSIETAKMLKKRYPDYDFAWMIGADMVQYLPKWHEIEKLSALIRFIGFARPGTAIDLSSLEEPMRSSVQLVSIPLMDISSTRIRERIRQGLSVRYMVPEEVLNYLKVRQIYES